jgi:membrane protease YdiL (CAAX protease family)
MQGVLTFLLFVPFLVLVVLANLADRQRWARHVTYGSLIATNVGLLGIAGLALLSELARLLLPDLGVTGLTVNWWAVMAICLLTSMIACLPLIPGVRRFLARWLPIDPGSIVHMTALAFAVYQIGLSLAQMVLIGDLENLARTGLSLTVWDVLLSGLPLLLFALLGVGWFLRRKGGEVLERLGLRRPTWKQLILVVAVTALLLAFDLGVNLAWQAVDPAGFDKLQRVTDSLFGGLMTVAGAVVLGLSAGISEELLFRGAVQPRLGLFLATVLFALAHLQYGLTIATLEVFVIGLVLGLVRNRTSTTTAILIHAGYNALGVLLGLLKP